MPSLHRTEGTKELLICESLSCHPLANYFSIPGRVTFSPVLHGKNKKLTASIKNVFLWLGIRNICRNELDIAARVWDKSFSNWEARHECGFEVLLLFESSAVVTVTCLWLFYHTFWKKRWAIFIIGSEKKVLKDTFINVKLETVLFTNFWSLASHKFTSWRPFKGPKWKTLLCRMSSCPKGLFLSLSRNTSHIQFILLPASPVGGKKTNLIAPTLLHLSISHGNLNCHNKVFFQDLSSNSLSFLPKWLLRESHKSRGGIVIRNRWTLNHRWFWERAKRSLPLRKKGKGGKIASTLSRNSKCFCVCEREPGHNIAQECRYLSPNSLRLRALFSCRAC